MASLLGTSLPNSPARLGQKNVESLAATTNHDDSKYIIRHSGPIGSSAQQSTAAAFFARSQHKASPLHHQLASLQPDGSAGDADKDVMRRTNESHVSDYAAVLGKCPPPAPHVLLKKLEINDVLSMGKVRVILRVANSGVIDEKKGTFFQMDKKKRQVTLLDPSHGRLSSSSECTSEATPGSMPSAPKMFAFDGLYTDEDCQSDICSGALVDPICSVVNGSDAALFCFGHQSLGKTYTMIGSDESSRTLGVIPSAIAWLFRAVKDKREKSNMRFSVRVSALEIGGPKEEVRDLLANVNPLEVQSTGQNHDGFPASAFLPQASLVSQQVLPHQTELHCSSAEKAGYLLDAALTSRSTNMADDLNGRDSHLLFTLHVYQFALDNHGKVGGCIGGRSRLHLIDFGSCDRTKTSGGSITLSGLGNVILGIFNGQRHLPFKESRVTMILKECFGSLSCQATMIAHVSPEASHYSETLHTIQLASRIHRMRRKKPTKGSSGSGGGSGGSGSSDENKHRLIKLAAFSSSDFTTSTDPSSSEQSCDTVIYVGSRDDDGTDAEHPPVFIPSLNSGDHRGQMSKVLRGSTAEMPKFKSSTLDRKKPNELLPSVRHPVLNSIPVQPPYPAPVRQRPGSVGSTPIHSFRMTPVRQPHLRGFCDNPHVSRGGSLPRNTTGKMPLCGKVAGYRQPPSSANSPQHDNRIRDSSSPSNWMEFQQAHNLLVQHGMTSFDAESIYGYGYMDEHKKKMIQQWVECQTAQAAASPAPRVQRHSRRLSSASSSNSSTSKLHHLNQPEPFAWLKQPQNLDMGDVKILTQFKTVDSSDDSWSDTKETDTTNSQQIQVIAADVHTRAEREDKERKVDHHPHQHHNSDNNVKETMESADPTWANTHTTFQELFNHCEQLVRTLDQEKELFSPKGVRPWSSQHAEAAHHDKEEILTVTLQSGGGEYLPDINEIEIVTLSDDEAYGQGAPDMNCNQTSKSSEENLVTSVAAFDGGSLHYVAANSTSKDERPLSRVCSTAIANDDTCSMVDGEEHLGRRFDQLAKLHELYQSVSSINAKCQSHLEASKRQKEIEELHGCRSKGSCFSLSAILNSKQGLDASAGKDKADLLPSSDVNSLCSEPVKMFDYSDFVDIRQNSAATSIADALDLYGKDLKCLSLGDLAELSKLIDSSHSALASTSADRSDSPVLEEIDRELAKYAQLKDLKHAYQPVKNKPEHPFNESLQMLRQADGASDPDLNRPVSRLQPELGPKVAAEEEEEQKQSSSDSSPLPLSSRSPGNGQSGSEPDEFDAIMEDSQMKQIAKGKMCNNALVHRSHPPQVRSSSSAASCSSSQSSGNGNKVMMVQNRRRIGCKLNGNTVQAKSITNDASAEADIWEKSQLNNNDIFVDTEPPPPIVVSQACSVNANDISNRKGPKFSRLFKISRSPLKIIKVEDKGKKRSKSADPANHKNKVVITPSSQNNNGPNSQQQRCNKGTSTKGNGNIRITKELHKTSSTSSVVVPQSSQQSKNVKGTSSSECSPANNLVAVQGVISSRPGGSGSSTLGAAAPDSNASSMRLLSPYTVLSAPVTPKKTSSSSSRASDSGHESGTDFKGGKQKRKATSAFIKSCAFVKLRSSSKGGGRGAHKASTSTSTASLANIRASHCKSSGYESGAGVDSERDSVNSVKGAVLRPDEPLPSQAYLIPPVHVINYDEAFIKRLDARQRFCELQRLQKQQEVLKQELSSAKGRINADPKRWSYDLHVAENLHESGHIDVTDSAFLEAFSHETLVLGKRVDACKSHVVLTTCFDFVPGQDHRPMSPTSQKLYDHCCTTDCEALLLPNNQETDIF